MIKSTVDTKGFNAHTTGFFRIVTMCSIYIYIYDPGSPNPPNCADWQKICLYGSLVCLVGWTSRMYIVILYYTFRLQQNGPQQFRESFSFLRFLTPENQSRNINHTSFPGGLLKIIFLSFSWGPWLQVPVRRENLPGLPPTLGSQIGSLPITPVGKPGALIFFRFFVGSCVRLQKSQGTAVSKPQAFHFAPQVSG